MPPSITAQSYQRYLERSKLASSRLGFWFYARRKWREFGTLFEIDASDFFGDYRCACVTVLGAELANEKFNQWIEGNYA